MSSEDRSGLDGARVLRLLVGLAIGFAGAWVTLQTIDRFDDSEPGAEPLEVVLGAPDFEAYCSREEPQLRAVATTGDAYGWECVGLVQRLWTTEGLEVDEVCRWQYGVSAFARLADEQSTDGWICAGTP